MFKKPIFYLFFSFIILFPCRLFCDLYSELRILQSNCWKSQYNSVLKFEGNVGILIEVGEDLLDRYQKMERIFACIQQEEINIFGKIKLNIDGNYFWELVTISMIEDNVIVRSEKGEVLIQLTKTPCQDLPEAPALEYLKGERWLRTINGDNSVYVFEDNYARLIGVGNELLSQNYRINVIIIKDIKVFGDKQLIGERLSYNGEGEIISEEQVLLNVPEGKREIYVIDKYNNLLSYLVKEEDITKITEESIWGYLEDFLWQDWDDNIYHFNNHSMILLERSDSFSKINLKENDAIIKELLVDKQRIIGIGQIKGIDQWEIVYLDFDENKEKILVTNNIGTLYFVLKKYDIADIINPILLYPSDREMDVSIVSELSWSFPYIVGNNISFDLYLSKEKDPQIHTEKISEMKYIVTNLEETTTYYWQIKVNTSKGVSVSPISSFTTSGNTKDIYNIKIYNPCPLNGQINVSLEPGLTWNCSNVFNDTLTFDLFFGETKQPKLLKAGLKETEFYISELKPNTTYYWKVIARGKLMMVGLMSEPWSFTTGSSIDRVFNNQFVLKMYPLQDAVNININPTLSWYVQDTNHEKHTYDVYFGVDPNSPIVMTNINVTSYEPKNLNINTKYYWKVNVKDEDGTLIHEGPVMKFKTTE